MINVWSANGFRTKSMMDEVHEIIFQLLSLKISPVDTILDLGCGNGYLLSLLTKNNGLPIGIDPDSAKLEVAMKLCSWGNFFRSDIFNELIWSSYPRIVLMSAGKFSDTSPLNQKNLLARFIHIPTIIFYSYGKYAEGQSIFDLFHKANLNFPSLSFEVRDVACTNDSEAVLLCPKLNSNSAKSKSSLLYS